MTSFRYLKCAKPLISINQDEEFPFSQLGTAFLVRSGTRFYCITARHCLFGRKPWDSQPPPDVFVTLEDAPQKPLPLRYVYLLESHDKEDWDFTDLAVYEIETEFLSPDELERGDFLNLDRCTCDSLKLSDSTVLVLRGYPSKHNYVDYERRILHGTPVELDGNYDGPAAGIRECSYIRFGKFENIDDFDGLSGSPLFDCSFSGDIACRLVGVLIRGTAESGRGIFIHANVVFEALRRISSIASAKPVFS